MPAILHLKEYNSQEARGGGGGGTNSEISGGNPLNEAPPWHKS